MICSLNLKILNLLKFMIFITFILFSLKSTVISQESINTGSGNAKGQTGNVSYSIGQTNYEVTVGSNGSIYEGVQLPYEIYLVSVEGQNDLDFDIKIFPNPVENSLNVHISSQSLVSFNMTYELSDINGKSCNKKENVGKEATIDMEKLSAGFYILKVTINNRSITTYKIIKR